MLKRSNAIITTHFIANYERKVLSFMKFYDSFYLHLVTIPSTQTMLPRKREVKLRGVTCFAPKLLKINTQTQNCLFRLITIIKEIYVSNNKYMAKKYTF